MSLARRSITSIGWNFAANTAVVGILAVRMLLLTRWLSPEIYGTYALAYAIIAVTAFIPNFGMDRAFVHRAPETENIDEAAATHFSLRLAFTVVWAGILLLGAFLFAEDSLRLALFVIVPVLAGTQLTQTPTLILGRGVEHRRLALLNFTEVALTTAVSLTLAWNGAGLWALLATDVVALVVRVFFLYIWRPVWKPRLRWDEAVVRYYVAFGGRALAADGLLRAIDRVDDLWTGFFLGQVDLGIYSRAYTFATYPRRVLAAPVNAVAGGTYAELKDDRLQLSRSFFRLNAFLIRGGFLLGGALALVAPELVLVLGEQWQGMLMPFRLLLIFLLLDPIRLTIGLLFAAVGEPQKLARSRALQLVVLLIGLFVLGTLWGVNGVALAVDIMVVAGIATMVQQARAYVDFKVRRLIAVPMLAFVLAMGPALFVTMNMPQENVWLSALIKLLIFTAIYVFVWLAAEWQDTRHMFHDLRRVYFMDG
ncbi:MAG: oligosaccharide flippase family protein [Candidatus Promineifilaceae bacterium]